MRNLQQMVDGCRDTPLHIASSCIPTMIAPVQLQTQQSMVPGGLPRRVTCRRFFGRVAVLPWLRRQHALQTPHPSAGCALQRFHAADKPGVRRCVPETLVPVLEDLIAVSPKHPHSKRAMLTTILRNIVAKALYAGCATSVPC